MQPNNQSNGLNGLSNGLNNLSNRENSNGKLHNSSSMMRNGSLNNHHHHHTNNSLALLDYFPNAGNDGLNISWCHGVNSRASLNHALSSK